MKNTTNTLNKLTKLLAIAIFSLLKDKPLRIAGEIE
jgi:hypothetical protein